MIVFTMLMFLVWLFGQHLRMGPLTKAWVINFLLLAQYTVAGVVGIWWVALGALFVINMVITFQYLRDGGAKDAFILPHPTHK
jgi:O-antigen/teichoic acid export membrane protein